MGSSGIGMNGWNPILENGGANAYYPNWGF
jgi:hypothetical protein